MTGPPTRLCCGQRHYGVQCPDGKVMCCLCFDRFEVAGLSLDDGDPIDVCKECAAGERGALARRNEQGPPDPVTPSGHGWV